MKTVCVFATIKVHDQEFDVMEHGVFGEYPLDSSAHAFIKSCEELWKKHASSYKITNVVIEG